MKNNNFQKKYLLDGRQEAARLIKLLNYQIIKLSVRPTLAVILIGNNSASKLYVALKEKKTAEIGAGFRKFLLPAGASEKKVIALIQKLNRDKKVTGLMLQLPLSKKFNTNKIISFIGLKKDVDGLRYSQQITNNKQPTAAKTKLLDYQIIRLLTIPPTIQSILHLVKMFEQKLSSKNAVILCNSSEFAEPLKFLLGKKKIKTKIILSSVIPAKAEIQKKRLLDSVSPSSLKLWRTGRHGMTKEFDIIITALGQKWLIKPEMIKKDAIIIDVGITHQNGQTFGDVHPDCFQKSKYISPVPGGVGPLTVAYLMKNLFQLAKK